MTRNDEQELVITRVLDAPREAGLEGADRARSRDWSPSCPSPSERQGRTTMTIASVPMPRRTRSARRRRRTRLDAPGGTVFAAWTDPARVAEW